MTKSILVLDNKYPFWFSSKTQYLNAKQMESLNRGIGPAICNGVDLDICKALFINNASTYTI